MKSIGIRASLKNFINLETSSSIILLLVSIIAIVWANSPFGDIYQRIWNHQFAIGFADTKFYLSKPLILWINDGLMAIFFFVIGLEIKREVLVGELTTLRKASLPLFAAIGGMVFPVIIFLTLNQGKVGSEGWGVPMATDIAFTLGVLKLLGKRVPLGLKIFLTAFAIVDDIGAVLVIALFYSANIQWDLILYAMLLFSMLIFMSYREYYSKYFFFLIGFIVWVLFLKSGVHPTIAGILMAFTIPISRKADCEEFVNNMDEQIQAFKISPKSSNKLLTQDQLHAIDEVETISEKVHSPLQHLEHNLHGWVSYIIMPIFALANAGVALTFGGNEAYSHITFNVALALIFGNAIGISLMSFIGIKLKLAVLPNGVSFKQIIGVSFLGGLGFTMSLFIVNLAYTTPELIAVAKMGVILGSLIAGIVGYILIKLTLKKN